MKYSEIQIGEAILCSYLLNYSKELACSTKRQAVIICPGGGYEFRSDREGEPVATRFLAAGMQAFVLRYSVAPARFPQALLELAASVVYVKEHAKEWKINPEQIYICGFSAGGHLCASLGTLWNKPFLKEILSSQFGDNIDAWKPRGMILAYPVITAGEFTHQQSKELLIGKDAATEAAIQVSLEKQVDEDTISTFIWHTQEDTSVPVENTLLFAVALRKSKVPFELHIYEKGKHGISLCDETTASVNEDIELDNSKWFELALQWIKRKNT